MPGKQPDSQTCLPLQRGSLSSGRPPAASGGVSSLGTCVALVLSGETYFVGKQLLVCGQHHKLVTRSWGTQRSGAPPTPTPRAGLRQGSQQATAFSAGAQPPARVGLSGERAVGGAFSWHPSLTASPATRGCPWHGAALHRNPAEPPWEWTSEKNLAPASDNRKRSQHPEVLGCLLCAFLSHSMDQTHQRHQNAFEPHSPL